MSRFANYGLASIGKDDASQKQRGNIYPASAAVLLLFTHEHDKYRFFNSEVDTFQSKPGRLRHLTLPRVVLVSKTKNTNLFVRLFLWHKNNMCAQSVGMYVCVKYIHTCMHTYINTYIHTYIHTYIYVYLYA
jgi:hypothetical protein